MEAYYRHQPTMPHFSGHYRQRCSGFGFLAMGIGQVALPLTQKFLVPAAKRIGKELIDITTRKKTPKQALKNTVKTQSKHKLEIDAASSL